MEHIYQISKIHLFRDRIAKMPRRKTNRHAYNVLNFNSEWIKKRRLRNVTFLKETVLWKRRNSAKTIVGVTAILAIW